jgi:hypothetical protein
VVERLTELDANLHLLSEPDEDPARLDEFAASGVASAEELARLFTERFFFGCEADDPLNAVAYDRARNPFGLSLHALFGSDIGHWDVPDMRDVVPEAYELVDDGRLDAAQFRAFTCDNPIRLHGRMNPKFFDGTPVAAYARHLLDTA